VGLWVDMTRLLHHPRSRTHAASSTLNHEFFPNLQILRHAIVSCFILVMGQNATPPGGFTNCHLLRIEVNIFKWLEVVQLHSSVN